MSSMSYPALAQVMSGLGTLLMVWECWLVSQYPSTAQSKGEAHLNVASLCETREGKVEIIQSLLMSKYGT